MAEQKSTQNDEPSSSSKPTHSTQNYAYPKKIPPLSSAINQENTQRDQLPTSESRIYNKEQSHKFHQDSQSSQVSSSEHPQNPASSSSSSSSLISNKERVETYWNSLKPNEKQDFLKVSYSQLLEFSNKFLMGEDLLLEACAFYELNGQWEGWKCCSCNTTFTDSEFYFSHVARAHLHDSLPVSTATLFPIDLTHLILMIRDGIWEPADVHVTIPILRKLVKSISRKRSVGDDVPEFDALQYYFGRTWPLSDDTTRVVHLKDIQATLKEALAANHLLMIHIGHVLGEATAKLQKYFSVDWLTEIGLHETHLCIGLLDASELENILDIVKKISSSFTNNSKEISAMDGNISLDKEMFHVLFDKRDESVSDVDYETRELPNAELLSSWIYSSPSSEQHLALWKCQREEKESEAVNRFREALRKQAQDIQANNDAAMIRKVSAVINIFGSIIKSIGAIDYQEILWFLAKSYIELRLEKSTTHNPENKNINVGEETTDCEQHLFVPEGNDVHSTSHSEGNSEPTNVDEDLERGSMEEDVKIEKDSHILKGKGKAAEKDIETEKIRSGLSEEEVDIQIALARSYAENEAKEKLLKMLHGPTEGATMLDVLGERACSQDDVEKEDILSLFHEWFDAVQAWCKSGVDLLFKKEQALAQFNLKEKEVKALRDKFVMEATKSK